MPGHVTATYGHSGQFLAKVQGKPPQIVTLMSHKNTVKGLYKGNFERVPYSENYRDLSRANCARDLIRCF